jgi:hypothetical protein
LQKQKELIEEIEKLKSEMATVIMESSNQNNEWTENGS